MLTTTHTRDVLAGDGETLAFDFTFQVQEAGQVVVLGVPSSAYTVAVNVDQLADPGGTVTFSAAPSDEVIIERRTSIVQLTAWDPHAQFYADTVEASMDRSFMVLQELDARVARLGA